MEVTELKTKNQELQTQIQGIREQIEMFVTPPLELPASLTRKTT